MISLIPYSPADIEPLYSLRAGETRLGQTIQTPGAQDWLPAVQQSPAPYVLLGVPEDLGVRANGGIGGAHTTWKPFLNALLNLQDNEFLNGKQLLLLGHLDCTALLQQYEDQKDPLLFRAATTLVDEALAPIVQQIVAAGKIPVLIGGGHNNAYPLLKGLALAKGSAAHVINMDAHADFRALEGRHSGNGFRYAYHEGYLKRYAALGLHEGYNNRDIWDAFMHHEDLSYATFEEICLRGRLDFETALQQQLDHVQHSGSYGVELDLDCLTDTLSSALSPIGFSRNEALRYLYRAAAHPGAAYLHLTEAVSQRRDGMHYALTGKLLAYLVQAFIKGHQEQASDVPQ